VFVAYNFFGGLRLSVLVYGGLRRLRSAAEGSNEYEKTVKPFDSLRTIPLFIIDSILALQKKSVIIQTECFMYWLRSNHLPLYFAEMFELNIIHEFNLIHDLSITAAG